MSLYYISSHRLKQRNLEETRMETVLLSIIVVSGLSAISSAAERGYHVVYELKTMTEAQIYCREKHTDLATISSGEDVEILNRMVDLNNPVFSTSGRAAWIGLYLPWDWGWSHSDASFYKPGEAEFRGWGQGAPEPLNKNEHCTAMHPDGYWYDYPCGGKHYPVCMSVREPNVTFILIENGLTWTEAQNYCRENYTDLASVRNPTDNQKVKELVPTETAVWIGLFREAWKWSDGSISSFRNWKDPYPYSLNETCVYADFNHGGKWSPSTCDINRPFICYSPPTIKRLKIIRLRVQNDNPDLDMNDPAVMEAILKQLKQRLKDRGLNDVKLSLKKQPDGKFFHKEKTKRKTEL